MIAYYLVCFCWGFEPLCLSVGAAGKAGAVGKAGPAGKDGKPGAVGKAGPAGKDGTDANVLLLVACALALLLHLV